MGKVMGRIKKFMGEDIVGVVVSATCKGLLVKEKDKVSHNGKGSDSDSNIDREVKGTREEVGNKKEGSSNDSSENERDVCKPAFMREVPGCERFNEHSSRDIYTCFKEYERCMKESKSVSVRTGMEESVPESVSSRDAVMRGPMRVVDSVVDRSSRASNVGIPVRGNEGFRQENQFWRDKSARAHQCRSGSCVREENCYRCGKVGHKKNEFRWTLGACFGCGETGHRISEGKKEKMVKCYRCSMTGHIARGCRSNRTNVICGNCGQNGHYARMCREQRAKCTECGVDSHIAVVCRKRD
ncbi:zinc finger CCHC domain-containing protein 7-like [Palaemon carinicauda]|uniref:zinc finger CCHC domain-containing protein 7-like n=1 Tax=Palaemon carinicauda TaxID=392227 RepID=UPI0035B6221F